MRVFRLDNKRKMIDFVNKKKKKYTYEKRFVKFKWVIFNFLLIIITDNLIIQPITSLLMPYYNVIDQLIPEEDFMMPRYTNDF